MKWDTRVPRFEFAEPDGRRFCLVNVNLETTPLEQTCEMACCGAIKEQSLGLPICTAEHRFIFHQQNDIFSWYRIGHDAVAFMELIKGDVSKRTGHYLRHAFEQYFTSSQFEAHFLRHSKGRSQRWQILGAKPFFVRGCEAMSEPY